VATVCERLDCLPLAIELAAVHVRTLPVAQLAEHLAQRLPLLRGGMRDLPMRQRTMEDAITWSYELLDESRRRVFRALAVFVGGWTLEAAQVVGWDAPPAQHETTLILADLVDASLVQAEFVAEQVRFRFLEVTHEFALARLRASGDEAACQRRHALWYARLAGVAAPDDSVARSAQLALDVPNIRAAIEWAEAHQDAVIGMQLAGLVRMASIGGRVVEATQWLERMLAVDDQARQHGGVTAPPQLRVERLTGLARGLLNQGRNELARQRAEESLQLAERILDESGISSAYLTQGLIALANGELEEAAHAFTESYVFAGRSGRRDLRTQSLVQLGELARQQGDTERAESLLLEGLEQARMSNEAWSEAIISTLLGRLATQCQDHATACKRYHRALLLLRGFGAAPFIAWCVEGLALTLCAHGETDLAVRLCAAAGTLREQASTPLPVNERDQIERMLADARAAIGDDAFAVAWNEGTTMSLDAIVAEGLSASAG
jgi:non-specific serine/threonine protein kinase